MRAARVPVTLAGVFLLAAKAALGQATVTPEFEVASVRAATSRVPGQRPAPAKRSGGPGTPDPGRVTYSNEPLSGILADAFDVYWNQISGPDWVATDKYDMVAKVPPGTTKDQLRHMLQNLMVERFHLIFHVQTKTVQGYELRLAAGGSKLETHSSGVAAPNQIISANDPFPTLQPGEDQAVHFKPGHTYARFSDTSIAEFGKFLGGRLSPAESWVRVSVGELRGAPAPVVDRTGLTGTYDFVLDYAGGPFFTERDGGLSRNLASMQATLTKNLGLKIVEAKVAVTVLVIDRIDRTPAEN
jgi:uncharacterized protein (TIGR03435 family)